MKYRIRTALHGSSSIDGKLLEFDWGRYRFRLAAPEGRRVTWLEVEVSVPDYNEYLPKLSKTTKGDWSLVSPPNPYHQDLIDLLQYLESTGAFWLGIRRLDWDRPEIDWVPESNEERQRIQVSNLRVIRKYPDPPTSVSVDHVRSLLEHKGSHQYLTIPMAFFREGMNEFERFRYIQAFFNFYFFLEGLFGRGGKNRAVVKHFIASHSLRTATAEALMLLQTQPSRWQQLKKYVTHGGCPSVEVTLKSIVELRGRLHHFSVGGTKLQGHPLNQGEFEWCAFLLMTVCLKLLPNLLTTPKSPSDIERTLRRTPTSALDKDA